jgi:RNA polymerase sigma-70 factor (ECF subfamily)
MSNGEEDIRALLERLVNGDENALDGLLDAYRPQLRHKLAGELAADGRLWSRFDASDVVQETFLDAHRQIGGFLAHADRIDFWVWLLGLARERRLKFLRGHLDAQCRSAKRQQALPDESARHPTAPGESPSSAAVAAEAADQVGEALKQLASNDREIIRLRVIEGRPNGEVAEMLGITPAAVAKRLERALRRMRESVDHSEGVPEP